MVPKRNQKRLYISQHCREALTAHVGNVLYSLFSGQVCLQPSAEDGYDWSLTESHNDLLQTNLGSGSVILYHSIQGELDQSPEMVTVQTPQVAQFE
ncbi:unnamed protein product [Penicillium salamii]|uniref:Uncharacterized protein n=1 Tax=Penicillium salamii TaxID=1612424 RepID=A0A9W4IW70_9EURO|nr:unnamed protein product [Penicillium salamii]